MKDMSAVYFNMPTKRLQTLRSQKKVRLDKTYEFSGLSWFTSKERAQLTIQIGWIDAVLASRKLQMKLPLE